MFTLQCFTFQGQVFSGADYRVYLLGNPVSFGFTLGRNAKTSSGLIHCTWLDFIAHTYSQVIYILIQSNLPSPLIDHSSKIQKCCEITIA